MPSCPQEIVHQGYTRISTKDAGFSYLNSSLLVFLTVWCTVKFVLFHLGSILVYFLILFCLILHFWVYKALSWFRSQDCRERRVLSSLLPYSNPLCAVYSVPLSLVYPSVFLFAEISHKYSLSSPFVWKRSTLYSFAFPSLSTTPPFLRHWLLVVSQYQCWNTVVTVK